MRMQLISGLAMLVTFTYCIAAYREKLHDRAEDLTADQICSDGYVFLRHVFIHTVVMYITSTVWSIRLLYDPLMFLTHQDIKRYLATFLRKKRVNDLGKRFSMKTQRVATVQGLA